METETIKAKDAYVFLTVSPETDAVVFNELSRNKNVRKIYKTVGVYHQVLKVETGDAEKTASVIENGVRMTKYVRSTRTFFIKTDDKGNPIGFVKNPQTGKTEYIHPSLLETAEATV